MAEESNECPQCMLSINYNQVMPFKYLIKWYKLQQHKAVDLTILDQNLEIWTKN